MRERNSLGRKIGYGLAIVALLFVLSVLGAPATVDSAGGTLAKLRTENDLSQSKLGEIDPASETIKLATLGLRGVAAQLLWNRAVHFKKVEDWTSLTATLEQLAKLQPNFITFWKYQSWNLSYNVSVEFDDYNDRYYWVRRGIEFLQDGNDYNRDNPALLWELGWVLGQKIGRADERVQYRRLFRNDDDFHPEDRPPAQRDNWLVSKGAYDKSVAAVDEKGKDLGKKSPSIFYASSAKSQMSYAEAIEKEGLFDKAVASWKLAEEEWREYGNVPIQHTQGPVLRFNEADFLEEQVKELVAELEALLPDAERLASDEARANLSEAQRAALEVPAGERDSAETEYASQAQRLLRVTPEMMADVIAREVPDKARDAKELAADISATNRELRFTLNYRETVAYDYWALRCEFEQTKAAVTARSLVYRAKKLFQEEADPFAAKELYEEAFDRWHEVFEQFPKLRDADGTTGDDVMYEIYDYNKVLEQLDEELSDDFPLWYIIESFDVEQVFATRLRERTQQRPDAGATAPSPAATTPKPEGTDAATISEAETKSEVPSEEEAAVDPKPPADAAEPDRAPAAEPKTPEAEEAASEAGASKAS